MHTFRQLGFAVLLLATTSFASQLAILRNGFSIRHERHNIIGDVTRLYTGSDASNYVDVPTAQIDHFEIDSFEIGQTSPPPPVPRPQASMSIDEIVARASDAQNIDFDFVSSVIEAESGFKVHAVSPKGAKGLMQLMPDTASSLGITNPFDPKANVDGGTRYLRILLEKYDFDAIKALAAYNAGPKRVDIYRGVPPYYETRAYVARIVREYNRKKLAGRKADQSGNNVPGARFHDVE